MSRPALARHVVLIAAIGLVAVACTGQAGATAVGSPATSTGPSASDRPAASFTGRPTVPPSDAPVTGEVPPAVMDAVFADLTTRVGSDASAATVVQAEAVEWPNGALGCPEPGVMYTQVVTPGYQVVLSLAGTEYDYRVAGEGQVVRLCEGKIPSA